MTPEQQITAALEKLGPSAPWRIADQAGIDPKRRAETLSIEDWERLSEITRLPS